MDKSDAASESAFRTIRRTLAFYARGKDEVRAQVLLDDTQAENQRLREALVWFYTDGISPLVHFNISDEERIRRANAARAKIEDALRSEQ